MKAMLILLCFIVFSANAGQEGFATYYTVASCKREGTSGVLTASGERYDESAFTCALPRATAKAWNMRYGQCIRITCLASGKKICARYVDRGPGKMARARAVVVDVTPAVMRAFGGEQAIKAGRVRVRIEPDRVGLK